VEAMKSSFILDTKGLFGANSVTGHFW